VLQGLTKYRLALLCAEKDPVDCHRMILVCHHLRSPELKIRHILADGSTETNEAAEQRLCERVEIHASLFETEAEVIEQAYGRRAEQIAYQQYSKPGLAPQDFDGHPPPIERGPEMILSVGLTRPFAPSSESEEVHWLQVNNVHFEDDPVWQLG